MAGKTSKLQSKQDILTVVARYSFSRLSCPAGFVSSIVGEFITKRGTLGQLGLITPNPLLLTFILAAASGASVFGFGRTLARAQTGNMSPT